MACPEKDIVRYKGVEKTKTASRKIKRPHGRLLKMFCDLEGFDVGKSFIVETVNQTEKNINENISIEGANHLKANILF